MSYIYRNSNAQYRLGQVQTRYFSGRSVNNTGKFPTNTPNVPGESGGTGSTSDTKNLYTNYSKQYEALQKTSDQLGKLDFTLPKAEDDAGKEALEKQLKTITGGIQELVDGLNATNKLLSSNASLSTDMKALYEEFKGVAKGMSDKLSKAGISIGSDGTLSLDKEKFVAALKEDSAAVKSLLTGNKGLSGQASSVASKGIVITAKISANAYSSNSNTNNWWQYDASSVKEEYQENTIGNILKSII